MSCCGFLGSNSEISTPTIRVLSFVRDGLRVRCRRGELRDRVDRADLLRSLVRVLSLWPRDVPAILSPFRSIIAEYC